MSKTQKQTQDTTTHQVQTPTNAPYVNPALAGLTGQIMDLSKSDPYSFVAGPDPLQTLAGSTAATLAPSAGYGAAADTFGGIARSNPVQAQSLLDNLPAYMSPYTDKVVNTSLADYDHNAGYTRAQNKLALAGDPTFGGSGGSIQTALSNDAIDRGRATLDAGLRDQGFQTGANLSNLDANRRQDAQAASVSARLAAAQGLTGAAAGQGADARADVLTQAGLGDALQHLAQVHAGAPVSLLGTATSLFDGLPLGLEHGMTTDGTQHMTGATTTSDPMGSLGTAALTAAALFGAPFTGGTSVGLLGSLLGGATGTTAAMSGLSGALVSDRRLKRDVVKVGERPDGLGVYLYRYLRDAAWRFGVMAQEVLAVKPHAVLRTPDGYLAVNYGAL